MPNQDFLSERSSGTTALVDFVRSLRSKQSVSLTWDSQPHLIPIHDVPIGCVRPSSVIPICVYSRYVGQSRSTIL